MGAAAAELYNELYRKDRSSQYNERNVCICGGGRSSLTRAVAALGEVNLGHFLPDYTAYSRPAFAWTSSRRGPSIAGDVSALPESINDGMSFFRAALERRVICVPGEFFDVNPRQAPERTPLQVPPLRAVLVGPEEAAVAEGVRRIQTMVAELG